jgi:hypothetical protein
MIMTIRIQLALLGLLVLAALGARWWWLDRKFKQSLQADAAQGAPAVGSERIEPTGQAGMGLQGSPQSGGRDGGGSGGGGVGSVGSVNSVGGDGGFPNLPTVLLAQQSRLGILNPLIDCVARLELDAPCAGAAVLALLPATRRVGSKTWAIEGFNLATERWESLAQGLHYAALQAGIQLVNRHGALQDVEFSEFVVKAGELAESLGASAEFPSMQTEVARARELEQFVLGHDIRLSLNLHAKRAAWSLPYLQQHAYKVGFVAGAIPGRWVLGQSNHEMIALTIDSHAAMADDVQSVPIRKLALTLDVAQVARGDAAVGRPFDVMADVAIRLSASMEAAILDEQGLTVDIAALQRTSEELEQVYDRLDAAGLPAGSPLAKRLFS